MKIPSSSNSQRQHNAVVDACKTAYLLKDVQCHGLRQFDHERGADSFRLQGVHIATAADAVTHIEVFLADER